MRENCPGLESNQHDPKVTSPSSYNTPYDKPFPNRDLGKPQGNAAPKMVPSKPESGSKGAAALPLGLAEIVAVWPQLPEHIKAAIKALVRTHDTEGE